MRRGEIYLVELQSTQNSIQNNLRPCIIVSNNLANLHSPVIHAIPITSRKKSQLPTHVEVPTGCGLIMTSTALCEQSMLLPKEAFIKRVWYCDEVTMSRVDRSLAIQFGLIDLNKTEKIV